MSSKNNVNPNDFLPLEVVLAFESLAEKKGVSKVARGKEGFLRQYEAVEGDPDALTLLPVNPFKEGGQTWMQKRNGFVARHNAQIQQEPLWENTDEPTRRHLSLIMWAYTPDPEKVFELYENLKER